MRIWADELVDFDFATTDVFDDPQHVQQVSSPDGNYAMKEYTEIPESERTVNGQLLASISYQINIFFVNSSLNQDKAKNEDNYPGVKGLWKPAKGAYNRMTAEVFSAPAQNAYIGDKAFQDSPRAVVWPGWDVGARQDDKLFAFADGHVELVPQIEWWATSWWSGYNPAAEDPRFRARLWDVKHTNPQGGDWNAGMDRGSY
ncbi:MAG: hypothetical protein ACOC3G_02745 [Phycisphaeraceae bacterium]